MEHDWNIWNMFLDESPVELLESAANFTYVVLKQLDEQVYDRLHQNLLHQPTRREKKLHTMMQDPVTTSVVLTYNQRYGIKK